MNREPGADLGLLQHPRWRVLIVNGLQLHFFESFRNILPSSLKTGCGFKS